MGIVKDIKNLLLGMKITSKHLGRRAITIQYPEERWTMPERSRAMVVLLSDKETGELNCTGCELCMRACPTAAILVVAPRGEDKKKHLKEFQLDNALCCFCGLCEEACNFSALKMATKYEFSTLNKDDLMWDMDKLQEMGRDVDYVDRRKKKVAKPKPKPAPEQDPVSTPKTAENIKSDAPIEANPNSSPEVPKEANPAKSDSNPKPPEAGEETSNG